MLQDTLASQPNLPSPGEPAIRGRSLWNDARQRLLLNRAAVGSMILLSVIAVLCIAGPWFMPMGLAEIFWDAIMAPPSAEHWLGTDANGRDLLIRTLYGGRVSLMVGLIATLVSLLIGVLYGATAGYIG